MACNRRKRCASSYFLLHKTLRFFSFPPRPPNCEIASNLSPTPRPPQTKEKELMGLKEAVNETRSRVDLAQSELDIYLSHHNTALTQLNTAKQTLESTTGTLRERRSAVKDLEVKIPQLEKELKKVKERAKKIKFRSFVSKLQKSRVKDFRCKGPV